MRERNRRRYGAGLRFSLLGLAGEAMVQEYSEQRKEQVILKVDASQLSLQPKT
jgi:hypothetical protein